MFKMNTTVFDEIGRLLKIQSGKIYEYKNEISELISEMNENSSFDEINIKLRKLSDEMEQCGDILTQFYKSISECGELYLRAEKKITDKCDEIDVVYRG